MRIAALFFLILYSLPHLANDPVPLAIPDGRMSGVIIDAVNTAPVEFANVVLYRTEDSAMVTGAITDLEGRFELERIPEGEYYMVIQFIGYEKKTIDNININNRERKLDLGKILLNLSAIQLEAAEIVADRVTTEYKLDRKVINVSQDISNTGVSAADVLEKSPSVRVDIDGNVQLRGSSNFKVFIDGKPSVLDGNEALQQIPANTIENIEVITNPSVKYDPDGTAGIININLKKSRLKGFSGQVDLTAATGDKYAGDLYLNYKTEKINFYGGIDWNDRVSSSTGYEARETYNNDTTDFRNADYRQDWRRNGLNFKGGLDYYITENATLSLGGEYGSGGFGWDRFRKVSEYSLPGNDERYYIDDNVFRWERDYYSLNTTYLQRFSQKGHELKVFAYFSGRNGSQKQDSREYNTDEDWIALPGEPFRLRSTEEGPSRGFRVEADYVKPVLKEGKFEAGYHLRLDDESEDYFVESWDADKGEWAIDDRYTKYSTFKRSIHAAYGIFSHEFKGLQYQVGLRGEYTYRDIRVENTGERSLVDRFDYFPSGHLSYRLKEKNQFMASYSRRIERPRGHYLEPFVTYIDESTRRIGNPDLLPEYTDSYELGYLRTLEAGNISVEAYFRDTRNKITWIDYYEADSGYFVSTVRNLNHEKALGVEAAYLYDITKWFNLNLSATYYLYQLDDLTGESADIRTSNNWDGRVITSFTLPTQTRFQLNFAYDSPTVTAQGRSEGSYYMDFTARQEFLKKSLSLTLKISDVFASRQRESYSYGENFYIYEYNQPESRVVSLTLTYRLNNFKKSPALDNMGGDGGGM